MANLAQQIRERLAEDIESLEAAFRYRDAALLAVLEPHQPEQVDYSDADGDSRSSADCTACESGGVPNSWPCLTVRAIAEAFEIEVDDA